MAPRETDLTTRECLILVADIVRLPGITAEWLEPLVKTYARPMPYSAETVARELYFRVRYCWMEEYAGRNGRGPMPVIGLLNGIRSTEILRRLPADLLPKASYLLHEAIEYESLNRVP